MAVIIKNIISSLDASEESIISSALKKAGIGKRNVLRAGLYKTSLDARKRNNIHKVSSVWAELSANEEKLLCEKNKGCTLIENFGLKPVFGDKKQDGRIAVIGFGPAGMFAALTLAEYGYKPVVFERGADVDRRTASVEGFWKGGIFDRSSNVQFGEGGAGTFSDGKLTTRIHDPLCRKVLEIFAESGAPEEILTKAKPHIGTDKLRKIVKNIRLRIIELGGEVHFDSQVTDIKIRNGKICSLILNHEEIPVCAAVAALGHSAADTVSMLLGRGVFIEPKPFSCGARIEHTRQSVNESLYGEFAGNPMLPEGEYQLSYRKGARAVYTFCMCPGGYVVPSQSEEKTIVTNGMSEFARNAENSNSALVVSVSSEDYGTGPLDGMKFAAEIEKRAYNAAGSYSAPGTAVGAFLEKSASFKGASVIPSYSLGVVPVNLDDIFPSFITEMMREGLNVFSRKMRCFGDKGAVLTAPETRTSSPVRITRGDDLCAVGIDGLYPCGEGAGYAGGIMSAAVDGIRCALEIMKIYSNT